MFTKNRDFKSMIGSERPAAFTRYMLSGTCKASAFFSFLSVVRS